MKWSYTWMSAVLAALLVGMLPVRVSAQDMEPAATLVDAVRRATSAFQDPAAASAAGYAPVFGCVSGPLGGANNPAGTFADWNPRVSCDGHAAPVAAGQQ